MPLSLNELPGIYYVAGRSFVLNGEKITTGDVVEGAKDLRNIESFVRSRHLIPVVENLNDVPVYHQKNVKVADLVEQKFKLKIKGRPEAVEPEVEEEPEVTEEEPKTEEVEEAPEEAYDPAEHTVPEVLEYVGDDQERAAAVLAAEEQGKDRSTLTSALEELLTTPEGENDE